MVSFFAGYFPNYPSLGSGHSTSKTLGSQVRSFAFAQLATAQQTGEGINADMPRRTLVFFGLTRSLAS
jgi:hypothetical protein